MIPETWTAYLREEDDELLGYIEEDDRGTYQARTLFRYPMGDRVGHADAELALDRIGLSYLADRWLLVLPERDEPVSVQVVEATPEFVTVKSVDYGYEGDYGTPFTLKVPVDPSVLRPERSPAA